jgi:ABC-type amino acid transport substrate-binding protein
VPRKIFGTMVLAASLAASTVVADDEPSVLHLLTEHNPPSAVFNSETGSFTGIKIDVARELMRRAKVKYDIAYFPVKRAHRIIQASPNFCMIAMAHTPERKSQYRWIKPTSTGGWGLFKRDGSPVSVSSFEDALAFKVSAVKDYPSSEYLLSNGNFEIQYATSTQAAIYLMTSGKTDLYLGGISHMRMNRFDKGQPRPVLAFTVRAVELGLACNKKSDETLTSRLDKELAAMQGFIAKLYSDTAQKMQQQ